MYFLPFSLMIWTDHH